MREFNNTEANITYEKQKRYNKRFQSLLSFINRIFLLETKFFQLLTSIQR